MQSNAANAMLGMKLTTGWLVKEFIPKSEHSTGSFFSVCYKVEKDGVVAFMKAFDFAKFFQIAEPNKSVVDILGDMIAAFRYERDLSNHCKDRHVTKVSFVVDSGEEVVNGYAVSIVPYLIFELADGDVRQNLDFSKKLDFAWRLKSLHDVAVGLRQLHKIEVSHQDLKPSNILLFKAQTKLGDLGRSICKAIDGPFNKLQFAGDFNYAPPEIMYGVYEPNWEKRVFATDCYLLGSLVVFYFSGISMTALLRKHLPDSFSWESWRGKYAEVEPYVLDAFSKALTEFETNVAHPTLKKDLRWIVEKLCYPFPDGRGHPTDIASKGSSFNLERFISKFDLLFRRAEYEITG
jgi:eukaryotic-like serine/threonine-protein kinase